MLIYNNIYHEWIKGQCKELVEKYLKCMQSSNMSIEQCRQLSREYLECRMKRFVRNIVRLRVTFLSNLMAATEEWQTLGFDNDIQKSDDR